MLLNHLPHNERLAVAVPQAPRPVLLFVDKARFGCQATVFVRVVMEEDLAHARGWQHAFAFAVVGLEARIAMPYGSACHFLRSHSSQKIVLCKSFT